MDIDTQAIGPMPRPDFAGMSDKKLLAYLKANQTYVSRDDSIGTRADMLATPTWLPTARPRISLSRANKPKS